MTEQQARRLQPQNVVLWDGDPTCKGEVNALLRNGIGILWEDGIVQMLHFADAARLSLWQPEAQP